MIIFKTTEMKAQFYSKEMCPYVFWKVHHLARIAEETYGVDFFITSVWRKDSIPHFEYRAVDIRVRDPYTGKRVISEGTVQKLKAYHDKNLRKHGGYDSFFEHETLDAHGNPRGPHIHTQRPRGLLKFKEA